LSHSIADMSLELCPLTMQSQVLPERFVYVPWRFVSCHATSTWLSTELLTHLYLLKLTEKGKALRDYRCKGCCTEVGWYGNDCWHCSNDV